MSQLQSQTLDAAGWTCQIIGGDYGTDAKAIVRDGTTVIETATIVRDVNGWKVSRGAVNDQTQHASVEAAAHDLIETLVYQHGLRK